MKKLLKYSLKTVIGIATLVGLYLLAFVTLPKIKMNQDGLPSKGQVTIYLSNNGTHTDFIIPYRNEIKDWSKTFNYTDTKSQNPNTQYIKVGWGDSEIYFNTPTWDDLTVTKVLGAAFGMNKAVLRVNHLTNVFENDNCVAVQISKEQYESIVQYIENTLNGEKRIENSVISRIYGGNCAFYNAKGRLSIFKVCNTWVNKGLYNAGLPSVFWTIKFDPIFENYKN
jgi:uncharacterized protein (TIGR02117 family)